MVDAKAGETFGVLELGMFKEPTPESYIMYHAFCIIFMFGYLFFVQIISHRYFRHKVKTALTVHIVSGCLMFLVGIMALFLIISYFASREGNWFRHNFNAWLGVWNFTFFWLSFFTGWNAFYHRKSGRYDWNSDKVIFAKRLHKYLAYLDFLTTQFNLASGFEKFAAMISGGIEARNMGFLIFFVGWLSNFVVLAVLEWRQRGSMQ